MAMSPPLPTKPMPDSVVFAGEEKKKSNRSELREDRSYNWSVTQDLLSEISLVIEKKTSALETVYEPSQPSAQLAKLICLTAFKKTQHTMSL